jgi:drug/metabolite transporter (DMT)-like permease
MYDRGAGSTFLVLAGAVAVVSTASILIRYAQAEGASSLAIAAGRLAIAAAVLAPFALPKLRQDLRGLSPRPLLLCMASGLLLAVHFWTWIASLEYTSVASSTVLVTTNPLWVALASAWLLRERPAVATLAGIGLTVAGSAAIFASDTSTAGTAASPLLGNTLALVGAVAASGYLLIGRALRTAVGFSTYVWTAYATAAVVLCLALLARGGATAQWSGAGWAFIAALALGPQVLGHTAFNWALRRLSATFVAVAILGEPVGSALLAYILFGETFAPLQLAGFLLLLVGIFAAARAEHVGRERES